MAYEKQTVALPRDELDLDVVLLELLLQEAALGQEADPVLVEAVRAAGGVARLEELQVLQRVRPAA